VDKQQEHQWEEHLTKMRGEVVWRFAGLEVLIGMVIARHYAPGQEVEFVEEVLHDEQCSFALKRNLLFKMLPDLPQQDQQDLRRLNRIRNLFAHCGLAYDTPDGKVRWPDPRDATKDLDFDQLYSEYNQTATTVQKAILEAARKAAKLRAPGDSVGSSRRAGG
jgi:hypothetical protein